MIYLLKLSPHHHSLAKISGVPVLKSELQNLMVRLGEPFELRAAISGTPTPMVQWMKERKVIQSSDLLVTTAKKGIYSLFIRKATKADQGIYR